MTRFFLKILAALLFVFCALGIGAFILLPSPWNAKKKHEDSLPRVIIPRNPDIKTGDADNFAELLAREETITAKAPLGEGELIISVLNGDFDGGAIEKQFVAYRNMLEMEGPIYITYIDYDEASRNYKRLWSAPTAATGPGTISLYTMDLLGDRSVCVILTGVNGFGEHTITIFRKNPAQPREITATGKELFSKIAELRIDGTITIKQVERSQAYQMGFGQGVSFDIAGYGRDFESSNLLDQVEIVYTYNPGNGLYEQSSRTRIPGIQVEQRRVRELLGNYRAFEEFISGLWYHTTPQGTIDKYQYVYFDPPSREIIFYGDETQQIFNWQGSTATRYGLYISSQNIRIPTLRRSIDIEMESLESIRVRVVEDVRLKIGVNAPWDGSYRRASPLEQQTQKTQIKGSAHIDAWYDGPIGKIQFSSDGSYEIYNKGNTGHGKYAFFYMDDLEFLELRSAEHRSAEPHTDASSDLSRETYLVEAESGTIDQFAYAEPRNTLSLHRVRIGSRGMERLPESTITMNLVAE